MCFQKDFQSVLSRIPDNPDTPEIRRQLENAVACRTCPGKAHGHAQDRGCQCLFSWQVDLENQVEFFLKS